MGRMSAIGLSRTAAMLTMIALGVVVLILPSQSQAAYEQIPGSEGHFGGSPAAAPGGVFSEEVQLGGASAMAVNRSGAGGVPKGTVYLVTEGPSRARRPRVAMFVPNGGAGLKFSEGWSVTELEEPYERCGPFLGTEIVGGKEVAEHPCPVRPESGIGQLGIAVDQSTGDLYVYGQFPALEGSTFRPGVDQVVVYTSTGSEVVTRFGEQAPPGQLISESPSKIHRAFAPSVLAINEAGEVFVYDEVRFGESYHRLMVFRPHEGNREAYEYVGEVAAGPDQERIPRTPVFDASGVLYVAGIGLGGDHIEELAHETPGPFPNPALPPICEYHFPAGGLESLTVDPSAGEPLFFSNKNPLRIRRIGACSISTHEFAGAAHPEEIPLSPTSESVFAMAVDPGRQATPARPSGQLYVASSEPNAQEFVEGGHSALGYIFAHPAELAPKVEAESVSHVTPTSALLRARINPNGFRTNYVFQYVSSSSFAEGGFGAAKEVPIGGGSIEGGGGTQTVTAAVGALEPDTIYVFRVVVASLCKGAAEPQCAVEGPAAELRTYPSSGLTGSGRAWELVSPAQKNGGQVLPPDPTIRTCPVLGCKPGNTYAHSPMQAAPDGESLVFEGTNFGLGGPAVENEYLARRGSAGWSSSDLAPSLLAKGSGFKGFSPTLESGVMEQAPGFPALSPAAPVGYANLYVQNATNPLALTPVVDANPPNRSIEGFKVSYAGASADGTRVFFAANDALIPGVPDPGAGRFALYEWSGGRLNAVSVLPSGESVPGSFGSASADTVSEDGLRAIWSDDAGQVYVRVDGNRTLQLPDVAGRFVSASKDGSRVLLSDGHLFAATDVGETTERYVEIADLTEGNGGFLGTLGQGRDLERVYFVDTAELGLPGQENEHGEAAEPGANNLYAWHAGQGVSFIAQLAATDNENEDTGGPLVADWAKVPANRTAEASPSGRYVAFLSRRELTGRYNVGPCKEISGTGVFEQVPCPEAFVYDAETGRLACASCNPTYAPPLGVSVLRRIHFGSFLPQSQYVTDSGRLFFDSQDSLSPSDTNEGVEDVYQWEPEGIGSCLSAFAEGGCVSLLSGGREGVDSNFLAADATGKNVFFTTRDQLVTADTDQLIDVYDAREGGGFSEEPPAAECAGEACQANPAPAPAEVAPASRGFQGTGNYRPPKCRKGKVRKHGKCAAKKSKKHHHKKKKTGGKSAKGKQGGHR